MAGQPTARTTPDLNRHNQARADAAYTAVAGPKARTHPQLRNTAILLTYLAGEYPAAVRRIDTIAAQPWPADVMAGSTSGGDISDPTGNTAMTLTDHDDRRAGLLHQLDRMDVLAALIVRHVNELDQLCKGVPHLIDTGKVARQARCTGGEPGTDGWERPECEELAVTRSGLCHACYLRQWRWAKAQAEVG